MQWFLELLEELGIECRVGHPAKIRAAETRKQKHDRRDARLIAGSAADEGSLSRDLDALDRATGLANLAARPTPVGEDASTIAAHIAGDRAQSRPATRAVRSGLRRGRSAAGLTSATLHQSKTRRLLRLYVQLQKRIQQLDKQVETRSPTKATGTPAADASGRGSGDGLGDRGVSGDPSRFDTGNQVASYIGMIPCEHSSGKRQRLRKTDQGRQLAAALPVDRSDAACRRERPGAETLLSAQAHPERNGQGQDRGGAQTGDPAVDHDARPD